MTDATKRGSFDDLSDVYDAMVDWPKRLAHEGRFYRRWFDECGVASVVDVACGTGQHAAMFHSWGMRVEGADVSPAMIERAKRNFGEPNGLCWRVRSFDEPMGSGEEFDAAVCVGNSLALAPDKATVGRAIARMLSGVRQGGLVVLQLLNLWHLPDGPCIWQKCRRATLPQGEMLVIKGVHRSGARAWLELLVADPESGTIVQSEASPLLGFEAEDFECIVRDAGASDVHLFGGYREQRYERRESTDLVIVAKK